MKKTAIISGISGQDGSYLTKLLLSKGYHVIGLVRSDSPREMLGLSKLGLLEQVELKKISLVQGEEVNRLLETVQPQEFYNLAAQSSVGYSFEDPYQTIHFNIISTLNILEAIRTKSNETKFYQAASSEMFGQIEESKLPLTEHHLFNPLSPYAVSKASAHWLTVNYRQAYGLFCCCGILFNHESALRRENFVTKKIIQTALRIQAGSDEKLKLGNLEIYRDWGYAPDYVEAMWKMLQLKEAEDFLICSGRARSLKEFVRVVFESLSLDYKAYLEVDEKLYRPTDLKIIYGNNHKAKHKLDWNYTRSFEDLIKQLIDDERKLFH